MERPELLAPVGNMECLKAAIEAGCDAIYLGGKTFGARSYAGNFSNEEIILAIEYAHLYGVKVYITVNTLVYESEVNSFLEYIDFLHRNSVDAIIIQDIGMLDLVRQLYPNLEIHASTQMHIHNLEGVKLLEELGVKRVVLSRELTINEIEYIKKNTSLEIEVFIHGALCVSYSGQCLMSSMIGGRSGNRGTCSQCCRMPYSLVDGKENTVQNTSHLLSTKDLNTLSYIDRLIDMGIDSLKIEGRMKRKEYVYIVVSLYRRVIDQYMKTGKYKIEEKDILRLKKIFNRKFTKGFLNEISNDELINSKRPNHMGVEIGKVIDYDSQKKVVSISTTEELSLKDGIRILDKEDVGFTITKIISKKDNLIELPLNKRVNIGSVVLKTTDNRELEEIQNKIENRNRKIEITGHIKLKIGEKIELKLNDGIHKVTVLGPYVEKALKQPMKKEQMEKNLNRFKDSVYRLIHLDYDSDDNIFIPVKYLNEVRRKAIEELNEKRLYKIPYLKGKYDCNTLEYKEKKGYSVLIQNKKQYETIDSKYDTIYVEDRELYQIIKDDNRVVYRMPRVMKKYPEIENSLLCELGGIYQYQKGYSDFSFNVVNSYSVAFLHKRGIKRVTLSYELTDRQMEKLISEYRNRYHKNPNLEIIISSYPEVMISKYKMLSHYKIKDGYLVDQFRNKFHLKENNDFMTIYHYRKKELQDSQKYFDMGITKLRIHL